MPLHNAPSISGKSSAFNAEEGRFESGRGSNGRYLPAIDWTKWKATILEECKSKSNREIAALIGCSASAIATRRLAWGSKKMEMQHWTDDQVNTLCKLFPLIGDTEMAELFTQLYPKPKGWTKKHIEKKRKYLSLHRSKAELQAIWHRNKGLGKFEVFTEHMAKPPATASHIRLAIWLAKGNEALTKALLNRKDLLELYRQNLILKTSINERFSET